MSQYEACGLEQNNLWGVSFSQQNWKSWRQTGSTKLYVLDNNITESIFIYSLSAGGVLDENESENPPKLAIYEQDLIFLQRNLILQFTQITLLQKLIIIMEIEMYFTMAPATIHPFIWSTSIIKRLADLTSK